MNEYADGIRHAARLVENALRGARASGVKSCCRDQYVSLIAALLKAAQTEEDTTAAIRVPSEFRTGG